MIRKLRLSTIAKILIVFALLYLFLTGINLIGSAFKLFGAGFAEQLISIYSNPFSGLFTGILVTSIVQSSSTTTSLIVGLAASGVLPIEATVPMLMGANMGTTVTNILVSLSFITRKEDFRRAFTAATMHDFFNVFTILVFFPLEIFFHIIEKTAVFLTDIFQNIGGVAFTSPLKVIVEPVAKGIQNLLTDTMGASDMVSGIILVILAFTLVVVSLIYMVKTMRSLVINATEQVIDRYVFRNTFTAFILGVLLTAIVQSSSVTTSMIVPLVAAGFLGLYRAYPFTLGANIGTTVTAILASMATLSSEEGSDIGTIGLTVAICHLMFNVYGTIIFLPLKRIPIYCSIKLGNLAAESKKWAFIFVIGVFFIIPLIFLFITN